MSMNVFAVMPRVMRFFRVYPMLVIYIMYFLWNASSLLHTRSLRYPPMFFFSDAIDMLLLAVAIVYFFKENYRNERTAVLMLALNGFVQQILRAIVGFQSGNQFYAEIFLGGLLFTVCFLSRAARLALEISLLLLKPKSEEGH